MGKPLFLAGALLALAISSSPLAGQRPPVATQAEMEAALGAEAAAAERDRAAVRRALDRPEVERVAERAGLDLDAARDGVGLLDRSDLATAADYARAIELQLAGGGQTFSINATTLIIILLLVIIIVLIAE